MLRKLALIGLLALTGCELEEEKKAVPTTTTTTEVKAEEPPIDMEKYKAWQRDRFKDEPEQELFDKCEVNEEESEECDEYWEGYTG